jgi:hypothetical protein
MWKKNISEQWPKVGTSFFQQGHGMAQEQVSRHRPSTDHSGVEGAAGGLDPEKVVTRSPRIAKKTP